MRVKNQNVNRRHKPEEERTILASEGIGRRNWVSPTKPTRGAAASEGSRSGSSSPTDVQQPQQLSSDLMPSHFQTHNNSPIHTVGGVVHMSKAGAANTVMHEDAVDKNPIRTAMVNRIAEALRAMKPHAPDKVLAALPRLALHVEKALFKLAKTEAEYGDVSTLRLRIAQIQENNAKKLLAQQRRTKLHTPERSGNAANVPLQLVADEQARIVFQHLQSWRQKLVNMCGVAPWDILPNSTLAKVALYMPVTEQELSACGVENEQAARFGSSLLQELQCRRSRISSIQATPSIKIKHCRTLNLAKRGSLESLAVGLSKKHKKGESARLAPAPGYNRMSLMTPAPLLPAVDSLPTLLPAVSIIPGSVASATTTSMAIQQSLSPSRLSCSQLPLQHSLFTQLQPQPPPPQEQQPENHMHLLVQGAGQLSKQQDAKSLEAYKQEVQSLRWMLHQSQQEKLKLEMEVQRLRAEQQRSNGGQKNRI